MNGAISFTQRKHQALVIEPTATSDHIEGKDYAGGK